jgi:peptidoglycan/LPS O-acetylase OafA/YrhL
MAVLGENLPLTAIRGLAAVWVTAFHTQALWFPDCAPGVASALAVGYAAVDIFFILSGFILAEVYGALRLEQTPRFWLRRICRVYPLHLAVMASLALLVLSAAALHRSANPHDWVSFGVVALLLQAFILNDTPWNPPSWSVSVELLCYAVFPLTLGVLRRAPGLVLVFVAGALAVAEAWVVHRFGAAPVGAGAVLRGLIGFHFGMALRLLQPHLPPRAASGAASGAALAGFAGIALGIGAANPVLTVLAGAATIAALAPERGLAARALSWAPVVWLGRVSFSIYMLHAELQVVLARALSHVLDRWSLLAVFLAILLPLSEVTYRFIEQPGRRLPGLLATWMGSGKRAVLVGRP